jgi:hypothetical protein
VAAAVGCGGAKGDPNDPYHAAETTCPDSVTQAMVETIVATADEHCLTIGFREHCVLTGDMLRRGACPYPKDEVRARRYFERACGCGFEPGCRALRRMGVETTPPAEPPDKCV